MKPEHEKLIAALLSCLSVASFLQLAQLLAPVTSPFVLGFLVLYVPASILIATNSFYRERERDRFDLSVPTAFENGVLVLRSKGDKCAAFFAFAFPPREISAERLRRTLTTLLKVLPHSSVLSMEMTRQDECHASFYIKLEKRDILQRTQQLVESALSSLRAFFGENNVRLLCDDALLQHLTLGIPGRIQRVGRSDRYTALLRTDITKCWLSAASMTNIQPDLLQVIETESSQNGATYRVIFSIKSEEQRRVVLGSKLVVATAKTRSHSSVLVWSSNPITMRRMRASEIRRQLGDIMIRNVLAGDGNYASFEKGADELLSFLALCEAIRSPAESDCSQHRMMDRIVADAPKWRDTLGAKAQELRCALESHALIWIKGFPLRVDARVGQTLFKIVPSSGGDPAKLRWLTEQMAILIKTEPASKVVLLPDNPSDAPAIKQALAKPPASGRIRLMTSVVQLLELLKECRALAQPAIESPAETVQKIL